MYLNISWRTVLITAVSLILSVVFALTGNLYGWMIPLGVMGLTVIVYAALTWRHLFIFLVLMTFGLNQTTFVSGSGILQNARWGMLGICALVTILDIFNHKSRRLKQADIPIICFLGLAFVSSVYSIAPALTLQRALSLLLLYIAVFFMVWNFTDQYGEDAVLNILFWYAGLIILASVVLIFFMPSVFQRNGRFQGILINPNSIGLLLAVTSPILFWRLMKRRDWVALLVMLSSGLSLLLSGSRNGFLAVTGSSLLLMLRMRMRTLVFLIIGLVLAVILLEASQTINQLEYTVQNSFALSRLLDVDEFGSGSGRLTFWDDNMATIQENIWTGSGFGTEDIGAVDLNQYGPQNFGLFHNSYLGILYQLGIPGFGLLFGSLVFLFIRGLWFSRFEVGITNTVILLAVLFANLLSSLFETWIYSVGNAFSFPFWVCVMLLVRKLDHAKK